ncbi:MAG: AfsR/SARP family transcriptional regulator [Anaerolineales bacterium]
MFEVRLLGMFDIKYKKKPVVISSRPAQSLFAYLALNAGISQRREKLAAMLWPDSLEETARDNLRHALWRARKALESAGSTRFLHANDQTIRFEASSDCWIDAVALEKADENISTDELIATLSKYQGELLPGFYDEWVVLEREHLHALFDHHMARLMSLLQEEKRWLDIFDWAERWIKFGQKPEPAYRALMSAHAAMGDMSKVAATYERGVNSLKEFGIEPSEQTKELYRNIKSGKETPGSVPATPRRVEKEVSSNIPVPLTSFVGREQELKDVARLLSTSRLLTLTGSGGVGKTRLAINTARDLAKKFKDGVFWVGLVGLSEESLIPHAIAGSLNVSQVSDESLIETLQSYLRPKEILLVIDNCEHLIRACAQVVEQLLAACPKLKILATSIEALGLFNETIWPVPSLPLPEARGILSPRQLHEFASVELFDERARNAKPGFILDERNAFSIAQICRRLDGIPLAIELAAARIRVLSVDEIAARLDDRFSLLTAGSRTAVPRHQTLRATIDWSHDLLTEPERILFRRLAVFTGGFTLEAAESVCSQGMNRSDILDLLGRLADKSLVIVESGSDTGETRYRLLETIRQYALERLAEAGEARDTRDGHLDFFARLAEQAEPMMFGRESPRWYRKLDQELDNIRSAIEWATNSGRADIALDVAGSLVYFWFAHGLGGSEWHDRVQQALSRPEGKVPTLARAKALNGLGFMYWSDFYPIDRRPELQEALRIGREMNDPRIIATALRNLGLVENISGNYAEARKLLEQSLEIWREMGPEGKTGSTWTMIFLGDAALKHSNPDWARSLYEDTVAILRELGDLNFLAYSVRRLAQLDWQEGHYDDAIAHLQESLNSNQDVEDPRGVIACLAGFAVVAVAQRQFQHAAQLMGAVETQLGSLGIRLLFMDKMEYDRSLAVLRTELDEPSLRKYWTKGNGMSLEETIRYALETS